MNVCRQLILGLTVLALTLGCGACQPIIESSNQTESVTIPPSRILFLGNSLTEFNGGIDMHLRGLVDASDLSDDIAIDKWLMMDVTLGEIAEHPHPLRKIQEGHDVVVLQAHGDVEWGDPQQFLASASILDVEISEAGGDTALLLPWEMPEWRDYTQDDLLATHRTVAEALDATIVPVGLAFQKVEQDRPDIELQWWDGHPTMHGTYLASSVFYAALFGRSPEGLSYLPDPAWSMVGDPNVTAEQAAYLQEVAWETVQEFIQ